MVDLSSTSDGGVSWLDASGDHADIVLSTRIRLARNVEGYAFTGRARDGERLRILTQVREAGRPRACPPWRTASCCLCRLRSAPTDRLLLHERHLVSKELAGSRPALRESAAARLLLSLGGCGRHDKRGGSPPTAGATIRFQL